MLTCDGHLAGMTNKPSSFLAAEIRRLLLLRDAAQPDRHIYPAAQSAPDRMARAPWNPAGWQVTRRECGGQRKLRLRAAECFSQRFGPQGGISLWSASAWDASTGGTLRSLLHGLPSKLIKSWGLGVGVGGQAPSAPPCPVWEWEGHRPQTH